MTKAKIIHTLFQSRPELDKALLRLQKQGFEEGQLKVTAGENDEFKVQQPYKEKNYVWQGIFVGGVIGGIFGFLVGLFATDMSYFPIVAGIFSSVWGTFLGILFGAVIGGVIGYKLEPDEHDYWSEELKRGGFALHIKAYDEFQEKQAKKIISESEARDLTA